MRKKVEEHEFIISESERKQVKKKRMLGLVEKVCLKKHFLNLIFYSFKLFSGETIKLPNWSVICYNNAR